MSIDELSSFLQAKENEKKEDWEKIRYLCFYSVVSVNGTKIFKKPSDLFQLPWEVKKGKRTYKKLTKEEVDKKFRQAEKLLRHRNG